MPPGITSDSVLADYSAMAACLFTIQRQQASDAAYFDSYTIAQLQSFETGVLQNLFNQTLAILGIIDRVDNITPDYLIGDFDENDFLPVDFHTGYLDTTNSGYSSRFQTILNVFEYFGQRWAEIGEYEKQILADVFGQVLDAFNNLQNHLTLAGNNPCIAPETSFFNNSPNLYLQAAGSNGEGMPQGIYLRWTLAGNLGYHHFPKGDSANAAGPMQPGQPADFVRLYRTPYTNPVRLTLDFETSLPAIDDEEKRWSYATGLILRNNNLFTRVFVLFKDAMEYERLKATMDPRGTPYQFLNAYTGLIELEFSNTTAFAIGFEFERTEAGNNSIVKLEALSATSVRLGAVKETVTIRKTIPVNAGSVSKSIIGENIHRIRIKKTSDSFIRSFSFETYNDFVASREATDWTQVEDGFGLSLDSDTVYKRLENPQSPINGLWPHFNDGATVRIKNYQEKWSESNPNDPSIKDTVLEYLRLSLKDPRAEATLKDEGADAPGITISYLDVLNLIALDYHVARMLGVGHIDPLVKEPVGDQFVYMIRYANPVDTNLPQFGLQEYMSLPTRKTDSRLPLQPVMQPLTYDLPVSNELTDTMFDENGYASMADVRIVNIKRDLFSDEQDKDFFEDTARAVDLNIFENPKPILYGIEYLSPDEQKLPPDQQKYVKPEITSEKSFGKIYYSYDPYYPDGPLPVGVPEPTPVLDNIKSLYVHFIKTPGVHTYAIYGINWFSRVSVLSEKISTGNTAFPVRNNLLPPVDVAVQYIQKEDTRLFTTKLEQDWLAGRAKAFKGQDTSFTRITFNWLDITDVTGRDASGIIKPEFIQAHFKHTPPLEVIGVIVNITPVPGEDNQLVLQAGGYTRLDGVQVEPTIINTNYSKFSGSILSTQDGQFSVISVWEGAGGPLLTIEKAPATETIADPDDPNLYGTYEVYKSPAIGSRFTLMENLGNPDNWEHITGTIRLVNPANTSTPAFEIVKDAENNETKYLVGGITARASIESLRDAPGFYSIQYEKGVALQPHTQINLPYNEKEPLAHSPAALHAPHVEWYKGFVRVADTNEKMKLLEVVRVEEAVQTDNTRSLVLFAYDPAVSQSSIKISSVETPYVDNVNFHPGYKVYLFPEPPPAAFNKTNIQPGVKDNDKRTLMGLQSTGTDARGVLRTSRISSPAILLARKIEEPLQPSLPTSYGLKVRPDATGKGAFTFDTKIDLGDSANQRNPFGFMFYRTSYEDILYALYKPGTVASILTQPDNLVKDLHNKHYFDLANQTYDMSNPVLTGLPVPDKTGLTEPGDTNEVKSEKYKAAIRGTLLPLTEQTPLWAFINIGKQTENNLPSFRSIDGNLIDPDLDNPAFSPFPMVRRYVEANAEYLRFTDYTLNASSRNLYFYVCAEVSVQLVPGPLSPFIGPVSILHTMPPAAPVIRSYTLNPGTDMTEDPATIKFQLTAFSDQDNITKVRIHRSFDQKQTASLSSMSSYLDVAITIDENGITVIDTFADLERIPAGETICYRLAGIRTIINEEEQPENVISLGSNVIVIKLIDTVNPSAPDITYDEEKKTLTWQPTTNNGIYYLLKQNARGNWEKISPPYIDKVNEMKFTLTKLVKADEEGNPIYHRFKVKVQNSSGLLNLVDNELTI